MLTFLLDGGPIMLPLLILSMLSVAIILDRVRAFRAAGTEHDALRRAVGQDLAGGDIAAAIQRTQSSDGPVAASLLAGLLRYARMQARGRQPEEIETAVAKTMEDYAPKAVAGLEKRLNLLVLIASVSPLLGMTGTVTGMIKSFAKLQEAAGMDPGLVAGGISEALITTAAGLIIAIPAVVAYNLFSRRVEEFNIAIEECVTDLVGAISER